MAHVVRQFIQQASGILALSRGCLFDMQSHGAHTNQRHRRRQVFLSTSKSCERSASNQRGDQDAKLNTVGHKSVQVVEAVRAVEQRHVSGVQQTAAVHSRLSDDREDENTKTRDRISQRKVLDTQK